MAETSSSPNELELLRKRQKELENEASLLRRIADTSYDWEYLIDVGGRLSYTSPSCERITGYTREELLGSPELFRNLFHPDDLEQLPCLPGSDLYATADTVRRDLRIITKNGGTVWVEHICRAIFDDNGGFIGRRASSFEITERRNAESSGRKSEKWFKLLAETAGMLLATENPQSVVNELCHNVMDYLECQTFFNFLVDRPTGRLRLNACGGIPEEDVPKLEWLERGYAVCGNVALQGRRIIAEDIQNTQDPRTDLVKGYGLQAYCCHPLMAQGEVIGTLSFGTCRKASFTDEEVELMRIITDQVSVAMQRITDRVKLLESEEKSRRRAEELEKLMDLVPVGIWIAHDRHCKMITGNQAAAKLGGIPSDPAVRRGSARSTMTDHYFRNGLEIDRNEMPLRFTVARGVEIRDSEIDIVDQAGGTVTLLGNASPLFDESGNVRGGIAAFLDITERKKTEQKLARLYKELELFAFVASHDLQEPLRKVTVFGDRLRIHCGHILDEKAEDYLSRMEKAANRMKELIHGIFSYAQLSREENVVGPVDLRVIADETVSEMEPEIRESGALIVIAGLPVIRGNMSHMRKLFRNMLSNSLKFRKPGVPPRISVTGRYARGAALDISFNDNGIGFDMKYFDLIFKPFQCLNERGEYDGIGMGLTICHKIVSLLGGEITAQSSPGNGADFVVRLPLSVS